MWLRLHEFKPPSSFLPVAAPVWFACHTKYTSWALCQSDVATLVSKSDDLEPRERKTETRSVLLPRPEVSKSKSPKMFRESGPAKIQKSKVFQRFRTPEIQKSQNPKTKKVFKDSGTAKNPQIPKSNDFQGFGASQKSPNLKI